MAVWLFGQCCETELGQARAFCSQEVCELPLPFATQLSCEAAISEAFFVSKFPGKAWVVLHDWQNCSSTANNMINMLNQVFPSLWNGPPQSKAKTPCCTCHCKYTGSVFFKCFFPKNQTCQDTILIWLKSQKGYLITSRLFLNIVRVCLGSAISLGLFGPAAAGYSSPTNGQCCNEKSLPTKPLDLAHPRNPKNKHRSICFDLIFNDDHQLY